MEQKYNNQIYQMKDVIYQQKLEINNLKKLIDDKEIIEEFNIKIQSEAENLHD